MTLSDINLKIKKGEFIAILGESGSGKSTLLDIILGLISPNKGDVRFNGKSIFDDQKLNNKKSWQSIISHVPQNPILFDGSISDNINFALDQKTNEVKLNRSIKLSNIKNFIDNLPNGFNTIVGENGSKISGGQKQRISIARALYKDCQVIILDDD